eukprot:TRINITY_DN178_c0_g2_i1.p1 TRINITY_DN178_c0_g2~~TRINITY_DN178_c0_g2_i1.p1  ORF type:complete len:375 (+),score=59.14 TRINITY_DN178_c0_g2_i1:106-1125(+)
MSDSATTTITTTTTSGKPQIAITVPVPASARKLLEEHCEILFEWTSLDALPRPTMLSWVSQVSGLFLISSHHVDEELLAAAGGSLKAVSTMSVGYDHIDVRGAVAQGIKLGHTPGVLDDTVADTTIALMLAAGRRIVEGNQHVLNGTWSSVWIPEWMCGKDLHHSRVGIIGMGRIGEVVAKRLGGFDSEVVFYTRSPKESPYAKRVELDTLISSSDFIVVLVPLNEATRGFVDADFFKKMKNDAILINMSRGGVVNQEHLIEALNENQLGSVGLDVTSPEPLPTDHPLLSPKLRHRVIVTPHIGSASYRTRDAMGIVAAKNLIAGLTGKPLLHEIPAPK